MNRMVIIDSFPESAERYREQYTIVVIDVIRSTTVATTAVSMGHRVFPARTTDEAFLIASSLENPLLIGELGGNMPYGFHLTNSPVQIMERKDQSRPIVLVSSSGTELLLNAAGADGVYTACFRNFSAVARHISDRHKRVAILGAGTRGQFRREDQMGCAWLTEKLMEYGFSPENQATDEYVTRWKGTSPEEARSGRSAEYLRQSHQEDDLEFILKHIDDLNTVPQLVDGELVPVRDRHPFARSNQ